MKYVEICYIKNVIVTEILEYQDDDDAIPAICFTLKMSRNNITELLIIIVRNAR